MAELAIYIEKGIKQIQSDADVIKVQAYDTGKLTTQFDFVKKDDNVSIGINGLNFDYKFDSAYSLLDRLIPHDIIYFEYKIVIFNNETITGEDNRSRLFYLTKEFLNQFALKGVSVTCYARKYAFVCISNIFYDEIKKSNFENNLLDFLRKYKINANVVKETIATIYRKSTDNRGGADYNT
jgi:hypothetical protein